MRTHLLIAVAVVCTVLPFAGQFYGDRSGRWLMIDFRAYYCAAQAQREGRNPYFADSLRACQDETQAPFYRPPGNVTVPAPYPPYALAFFTPFTWLPFNLAAIVWWILLAICVVLAAVTLARLTAQPFLVGWAALVLSLGLASWTPGNVVGVGIAALVLAAFFVRNGNFWAATVAIVVAMIEPQIALPAAVALFVRYPELRLRIAGGFALLAAISLLTAGLAGSLFYATTVVPAHALSEVSRDNQYSVSTILSAIGVSDTSAVLAGSIAYVAMSVVGIVVALRLARQYGDAAFVALVPPALALLGGSFVHAGEIAAAVPAALLLFTRAEAYRGLLFAAVLLLAVPWGLATSAAMWLAPVFPAAYLGYALSNRDRTLTLAAGVLSAAAIFALFKFAATPMGPVLGHSHVYAPIDPRLAEAGWRELVLGNTTNHLVMWLLRLPTWAGLFAFGVGAIAPALTGRRLAESRA